MAGTALGGTVAALLALDQVRRVLLLRARQGTRPAPWRELASSSAALLGLVVLANVDVLLARRHLSPVDAGLYAVGAVFAKAAFWAPQVVVVVAYPRLAGQHATRVLRQSVLAVVGSGVVLVVGTALLAEPLVELVFGDAYSALAGIAWLFTALGGCLALVQLLVFSGIAGGGSRMVPLVAAAAVLEAVLLSTVLGETSRQVVGTALAVVTGLALLSLALLRQRRA